MQEMYYRFEQYLVTEKMVSVHTVAAYKKDILQCIEFLEKQKIASLEKVTPDDIKLFLRHLRVTLKISARSASRKLSSLKSFSSVNNLFCLGLNLKISPFSPFFNIS